MSLMGEAMTALRNVVLMQSNLERVEREVEKLGNDQAAFREVLAAFNGRLIRVETIIEEARSVGRGRRSLPGE